MLRKKTDQNTTVPFYSPADTHLNFTTEGCFCPDGMKLFNKKSRVCVDKCGKYTQHFEIILIISSMMFNQLKLL